MPTWYMDYENGTDANASVGNGDSFATRRKRIDNFVAAAIAPGDTIRIMGSPAPTSIGNATWTDGPLATSYSVAGTNFSNATPIVFTNSTVVPTLSNGDTLIVTGVTGNTNANGVWLVGGKSGNSVNLLNADGTNSVGNGTGGGSPTARKFTNAVVTLATACTQNIALCGNRGQKGVASWVASANVSAGSVTSDFKEGGECLTITTNSAFSTGKAAYYTLPATLDLSGYQQVSFWFKPISTATPAIYSLRLCTDTTGDTSVHTINIPATAAANQWTPMVIDLATNLNSAIQSIALYVDVDDSTTRAFYLDNIIACKAASANDSLNLTSLISKDPGDHSYGDGYECWFGIQSINGTRVVLDGTVNSVPGSSPQRGYSGTTETVTTYKRETIKTVPVASGANVFTIWDSGSSGNLITFSGGWNRTDMSTQTLETWFSGQNGLGNFLYDGNPPAERSYLYFDKINACRYGGLLNLMGSGTATGNVFERLELCNMSSMGVAGNQINTTVNVISAVCCGGPIQAFGNLCRITTIGRADSTTSGNGVTTGAGSWTGTVKQANNCASSGLSSGAASYVGSAYLRANNAVNYAPGSASVIGYLETKDCASGGISFNSNSAQNAKVLGGFSSGNSAGVTTAQSSFGYLRNFTINEATEVSTSTAYFDGRVYSEKHDGTAGNNRIFCDGGLISTDSGVTHGTASYSWKFSPTSTNRSQYYPLNQAIAQIAVGASSLVTVKAWFRRDNTGLTGRLVCKGGQLAGVASDVITSMTAAGNTWEELTITFTPSEAGVIEVEAQFYGGTTYNGWVGDLTITQA